MCIECGMPAINRHEEAQVCPSRIPKSIQVCISRWKNVSEPLWLCAHSLNMNSYQCCHTPEANNRFKDFAWKKCIHFLSKFQIYYQFTLRCNTGCPCPPPLIHQWKEHPWPLHLQHLPGKKTGALAFGVVECYRVDFFPKSIPWIQPLKMSTLFLDC